MPEKRPKIRIEAKAIKNLKRRMLKHYPNEYLEVIAGVYKNGVFTVKLFLPIEQTANRTSLQYSRRSLNKLKDQMVREKLIILGTIHSHPNSMDGSMSEIDLRSAVHEGELVSGICSIYKAGETKIKRTRFNFWLPMLPINLELV